MENSRVVEENVQHPTSKSALIITTFAEATAFQERLVMQTIFSITAAAGRECD